MRPHLVRDPRGFQRRGEVWPPQPLRVGGPALRVAEDKLTIALERGPPFSSSANDDGIAIDRMPDSDFESTTRSTLSTSDTSRHRSRCSSPARNPVRTSIRNTLRAWSSVNVLATRRISSGLIDRAGELAQPKTEHPRLMMMSGGLDSAITTVHVAPRSGVGPVARQRSNVVSLMFRHLRRGDHGFSPKTGWSVYSRLRSQLASPTVTHTASFVAAIPQVIA